MLTASAPSALDERIFHLRGPLVWRDFDGEWVVMAVASSNLNQLDPVAAAVLGLIEAGPCSTASLLAALREAAADGPQRAQDDAWAGSLARALHHLQTNDLVVGRSA